MATKTTKSAAAPKSSAKGKTRTEKDLLGPLEIPVDALYGVQTARGMQNFKISNIPMNKYPNFIKGFAYTKWGAAIANHAQGLMSDEQKDAIVQACKEIIDGQHHEFFTSDMIQGGAGTTMNMNANEVIANRALQIMGHKPGEYKYCDSHDQVNCSQSTNDAYPTAMHFGLYFSHKEMIEALEQLAKALDKKGTEFAKVVKMGRTQLQDAVPMTLGQTFKGFAAGMKREIKALNAAAEEFLTVNMGATAIGTGICSQPGYSELCVKALSEIMGMKIKLDDNLVFVTSDNGAVVNYSAGLKRLAIRLGKICNDLRLMGSGPRCGLQEVFLPPMQPGSSIMPGKVNPVMPEVMNQICFDIIGKDVTITLAAEAGQLELNVMEPVIAYSLFSGMKRLGAGCRSLVDYCIRGITANRERCRDMVYHSIGIVTALNPYLGYETSASIAREALESGRSLFDIVLERGLMTREQLDDLLAPEHMLHPGKWKK